ncbi:hypothetical protein AXG93_2891s1180 [Marchantia polymorpha subsp. ruderalis]|uniref:Uncharacterized protein n=1 Tax=Marchantia polymorpha subsp. ruderalis TaxID=1480154 RepID=A0A176WMJ5_MARPO|nr:hypothetical protein AXG93_2891s1180 [Marchantia polymorpha subsp. ruderalis]
MNNMQNNVIFYHGNYDAAGAYLLFYLSVWKSVGGSITIGAAVEVVAAGLEAVPESPLELLAFGVEVAEDSQIYVEEISVLQPPIPLLVITLLSFSISLSLLQGSKPQV